MIDVNLAFSMTGFFNYESLLASPLAWIAFAFQIWMLIDAVRRQEWFWVVFIILFPLFNAVLYYFLVYRNSASLPTLSFQLPGMADRRQIQELETQIHHLDKAHHHSQLGDIYSRQGKFDQAEECYRKALERDPDDLDTRAHLGRTLLELGKPEAALPFLAKVCQENPKHDYGQSLMDLAEIYSQLGQADQAIHTWQQVVENYSYARARVRLAELQVAAGQPQEARAKLQQVVADDVHAPDFERRQDRVWIRRARKMLASLPEN